VGKTVTTEMAFAHPGPTTNPHDPAHTPGGSSSGSAAAVAAGMVRLAFGTQTGGSMIRPASFCGVIGFKPTFGLVPTRGVSPLAPSLDTVGWYARTVDDVAAVLDALTPRGREVAGTRPPRLGLYRTHDWDHAAEESRAAVTGAAARLAGAGADVVELDVLPDLEPLGRAHGRIMSAEAHASLAHERLHHRPALSPRLCHLLDAGARVDVERYAAAQRAAAAARVAVDELMRRLGLDALVTPATVGAAPAGLDDTGDPRFNRVWTLLGVPAISLPGGRDPQGLPVGVQFTGARWADRELLAVARFAAPVLAEG
jgi:Asp-tRNA(Asn)/Glu-tRNA(Gln) amidotransferase A subunit family amidase